MPKVATQPTATATVTATTIVPELLAGGGAGTNGYRRAYRMAAQAGECWLQWVTVLVRYQSGDTVLVDYRAHYGEWFRFLRDGASVTDLHDFHLRRDGWSQASILHLLQRHGSSRTARWPGAPRLCVRKSFVLGRGAVQGAQGVDVGDGVQFGFLPHCAGRTSHARIVAHLDRTQRPRQIAEPTPFPGTFALGGSGAFTDARGLRAFERFDHDFACGTGVLRDRGSYRPTRLWLP